MDISATPFDTDAPEGGLRPIIRYKPVEPGMENGSAKKEMVNARWGSNPRFSDGVEYRFVRSEGKTFPSHRCLIPASEFHMRTEDGQFRVTREDGNFFYLAGIWEPAMAGWPLAFRVVTVDANQEVSRYQTRHGAMIPRSQVMVWLDATRPESDLLITPPPRTFLIEEIGAKPIQTKLSV